MSSLSHHGIKGQRWGVRRFQNKDGTRTALGKHRDFERTASKVIEDLSNSPQPFIRRPLNKDKIRQRGLITQAEADQCADLAVGVFKQASKVEPQITGDVIDVVSSTSAKMYGLNNRLKQPTSIAAKIGADAKSDGVTFEQAANGLKDVIRYTAVSDSRDYADTYNTIKQRLETKGYTEVKCKNYFQKYQNGEVMHKAVQSTFRSPDGVDFEFQFQTPESQAAKELKVPIYNERRKAGNTPERNTELEQKMRNLAEQVPDPEGVFEIKSHSGVTNPNKVTHTSIGGTMYIEGNALILGDSSYLEHHGIKGQRWGVRRFQNRDGSLTNAGRKRLGYATKGAAQTVGKAFKAGVKVGGNAVKAAKVHHEEAEAKKKEKKKKKASQSRLGVLANKDLFTDDELRALNQRFKVEDELKMASIQKGVEIAKAVGTIASNASTAAKAYEDVTGQSLSPIKRQAAELKKQQDAEDRARKIAREDAEEARKVAQEERNVKTYEQELRKATASADKEEFLAKKTKAQADQEILKALKGARDFDKPDDDDDDPPKSPNGGGGSDDGSSWVQKATAGGKNIFEQMKYDNDPEYRAAKDAHDEKVEWDQHVKERDARIADREKESKDQALRDMINQSNARTGRGQSTPPKQAQPETTEPTKTPRQDSDALFSQKGSLPIDKDRYRNRKAAEKAKKVKEDVAEDRAKKQDEKAAKAAIDTIIKDYQRQDDTARNLNPSGYDRQVALSVIKSKAKNTVDKVKHPVDTVAKKISDKAREERWAKERAKLYEEYQDDREKLGPEFANETYLRAKRQSLQNLGYKGEALEKKLNENSFSKKKKAKHDAFSIQNGVLFVDESVSLSHHGIKGQRWGVRRFQNADGTLTEKGRKHYEKALAKEKRKQASSDAIRGTLERQHPFAVTGAAIAGAIAAGMSIAATGGASVAAIAAGSAISAVVSAGLTHATYSVSEAWEGRGTRMRSKKIAKYEGMLKQSDMEEGMYRIENGTLFVDPSESYLEHHGVLGMKWGKHLRAGKGPASAPASAGGGGGGAPEEDEETKKKIEEAAKKAGMSVDEYRKKFADKVADIKKAAYNAAGGNHKTEAARKDGMQAKREKRISDAKNSVEKAARANEAAYKHATEVYRQTGRDSDAYRQAIKRSQTTLWRSLDNQERLKQKRRRPADIGKKRAKHLDGTNAIYTEGTRLVVNSKWG